MLAPELVRPATQRSVIGKVSVRGSRRRARSQATEPEGAASPPRPSAAEQFATRARLQRALRPELSESMNLCGKRRHASTVGLHEYSSAARGARVVSEGVARCKQRLCMFCSVRWQRVRAREIRFAIDYWEQSGQGKTFFVTVTMRHNKTLSLAMMRRLLTTAWGLLWSSREGKKLAKLLGGKPESIRADDDTYSFEAKWHPHTHGLLFTHSTCSADELEELIAKRWAQCLTLALSTFQKNVARVLEGDRCATWYRHQDEVLGYPEHRQGCTPESDGAVRELVPGAVELDDQGVEQVAHGHIRELESAATADRFCCADAGVAFAGCEPSRAVRRFRRTCVAETDWTCRPDYHRQDLESLEDSLRDAERPRWGYVAKNPQCWECENGQECPQIRSRMEKTFGRRMVRPHQSLIVSATAIQKLLQRFSQKAIAPNRRHGVLVEEARDSAGLGAYLSKMGAWNPALELASQSTKLGNVGSDGLVHYSPRELAQIAAMHGHPDRERARKAYGELLKATFGLQPITFSNRERLGLGADPLELDALDDPDEVEELKAQAVKMRFEASGRRMVGDVVRAAELENLAAELEARAEDETETKRFLGSVEGETWDRLIEEGERRAASGVGTGFLAELVELHRDWRLESVEWLEPSSREAAIAKRVAPVCSRPVLKGPSYLWGRHQVETEIRDREAARARRRAELRQTAEREPIAPGGRSMPDETEYRRRHRLQAWASAMQWRGPRGADAREAN